MARVRNPLRRNSPRHVGTALGIDVAMIILFAAIGRTSHHEGTPLAGTLRVAAPFVIGYLIAAAVTRLDLRPYSLLAAARAWLPGIALGMLLRRFVFDRGTQWSFVIVAFIATAILLAGWRLLAAPGLRRRGMTGR